MQAGPSEKLDLTTDEILDVVPEEPNEVSISDDSESPDYPYDTDILSTSHEDELVEQIGFLQHMLFYSDQDWRTEIRTLYKNLVCTQDILKAYKKFRVQMILSTFPVDTFPQYCAMNGISLKFH